MFIYRIKKIIIWKTVTMPKFTTCMEADSRNIFVVDNDSFMTGRSPNYMGIDENQHIWL